MSSCGREHYRTQPGASDMGRDQTYLEHQLRQAAEEVSALSCKFVRCPFPQPLTPDQVEDILRRHLPPQSDRRNR